MTYEQSVIMFNKVHPEGYYSYPNKTGSNFEHFDVLCNRCNSLFSITPSNHKRGHGCPSCAYSNLPGGWTNTDWEQAALASSRFDSFKVYIVHCWNKDKSEEFIKIGKTFRTTDTRFKTIPYQYLVVKEVIFNNAKTATEYECELKLSLSNFKYKPLIKFNGKTECFTKEALEKISE